jgi:hypothetical protein
VAFTVENILRDAVGVYRLLFRRSVAAAALIYAPIAVVEAVAAVPADHGARLALGLFSFVLGFAGLVLVQGALVEIRSITGCRSRAA